jgi:hypothetical protein
MIFPHYRRARRDVIHAANIISPPSAARQIDFCISLPPPIAARASHFPTPAADEAVGKRERETLARAFLAYRSLSRQFISN